MRWQLSYIFFSLLGFAQSISKNGRRLLVVVEEVEKKDNHSELWADLEGAISFGRKRSVRADFRTALRARFQYHL